MPHVNPTTDCILTDFTYRKTVSQQWYSTTLLHFDDSGKVCEARVFLDTQHFQNHLEECERL